jgi:hypothetical protein
MRSMAARAGLVSLFVLGASCNGARSPTPAGQVAPSGSVGADAGRLPDAGFDAVVDASSARPVDGGGSPRPADAGTADARRGDGGPATADPDPIAPGYLVGACEPAPGLRLLAPLSGSTMTTAHPRLQFDSGLADGVDVQICQDRACSQVIWQQTVAGRDVTPPDLPPGYWFWRARATESTAREAWTSAWVFRVRHRAPNYAPLVDTVAERFNDFNGDGCPDAVVEVGGGLSVYFGGSSPLPPQMIIPPDGSSTITQAVSGSSVDMNGDGFTDFPTLKIEGIEQPFGVMQFGSPSGLLPSSVQVVLVPESYPLRVDQTPTGVGDVDGDGYGDVTWFLRYGGMLIHGCAGGVAAGPWVYLPCDECEPLFTGDLNGDGRADILYGDSGEGLDIFLGAVSPVATFFSGYGANLVFDANQDGYADLIARATDGKSDQQLFFGGPQGVSAASAAAFPSSSFVPGDFNGDGYWDSFEPGSGTVTYGIQGPPGALGSDSTSSIPANATVIDFNGDGYDDLVAAARDAGLLLYAGSPQGLSAQPVTIPAP